MKTKIAVFYHLGQFGDWKSVYKEQMDLLVSSGLFDRCEFIHIGINGSEPLPLILSKTRIQYNKNHSLEADTLASLSYFSKENPDYKVLYFYSKGVSHVYDPVRNHNVHMWRLYMEYFNIHTWEENVTLLDQYDCVGVELREQSEHFHLDLTIPGKHYSGNFWWANTSYISTLDPEFLYDDTNDLTRWQSEKWIGSGNPNAGCRFNFNYENPYFFNFPVEQYKKNTSMNINYKFSLITPEHSPNNIVFLLELYETIRTQTYTNWEWIIYLNNRCVIENIPDIIKNDSKVIIIRTEDTNGNIGAIKNAAFKLGTGDILVEVDHDDLLTDDCLAELNAAYQDPEIGFVYSDDAVLHMKDLFVPYGENNGWTYRMFKWKDKELFAMNSFKPTSQSIGFIWYAPDHVRSWRRDVYLDIGGHNPELSICDDHELCIRTYLKTKMKHIPKVLYIYRVTGDNTWLERNEAIQIKTVELQRHYARELAERDADLKGLKKVDIGGGLQPYPGYFTIDLRDTADLQADLNDGIPLPDNSVGVLNASHIVEHLHDKTKIMSEIHRVLAHGGWAFIDVPSTDGRGAFQDPTHVSYWNENSFLYYTDAYLAQFIDNTTIRFQEYRRETYYPNEWMKSLDSIVTTAWLVAIKDKERFPGILKI